MNKTETEFSHILEQAKRSGQILKWHFEEITLKIAPNTRYIPDFIAVLPDGHWQVFEIKGHLEDDAAVKFKAAAEKFPEVNFHMIRKRKKQWETIYNIPSPPPYKNNSLNNSPDNPPEVTPKKGSKNKKVNGGEPKWTLKLLAE
jgi:hypothetical protein